MELPISLLIQLLLTACVGLNFIGKITDLSFGIENGSVATVQVEQHSVGAQIKFGAVGVIGERSLGGTLGCRRWYRGRRGLRGRRCHFGRRWHFGRRILARFSAFATAHKSRKCARSGRGTEEAVGRAYVRISLLLFAAVVPVAMFGIRVSGVQKICTFELVGFLALEQSSCFA